MNLEFDIENVEVTEFGVGYDNDDKYVFALVSVDADVKTALRDMVENTCHAMRQHTDFLFQGESSKNSGSTSQLSNNQNHALSLQYEPSQDYGSTAYLCLATDDPIAKSLRDLHEAENLQLGASALNDPTSISFYFARLIDNQGRRLTALRRAMQFKGVIKSRLIQLSDDTLRFVEDRIFKLNNDFDLLIDSANLHIWRPHAFEAMGKLTQTILNAVPANVSQIQLSMPFIDFENIRMYASEHPRAAKYLASIRKQNLAGIDRSKLKDLCQKTGVVVSDVRGKIAVAKGDTMSFLEVLDRRRYVDVLDPQTRDSYRATKRQKILRQ